MFYVPGQSYESQTQEHKASTQTQTNLRVFRKPTTKHTGTSPKLSQMTYKKFDAVRRTDAKKSMAYDGQTLKIEKTKFDFEKVSHQNLEI